jgi:hypothetical protein
MSANFYRRPIEDNEWRPNIAGVDFTERVLKALGEAAMNGIDTWTAWVDVDDDSTGEGYTEQLTQENCQLAVSDVDDDSDCVMLLDRRDSLWFRFTRLQHPDIFDWVASTVAPWAMKFMSIVPLEQNYNAMLKQMVGDVDSFEIPEDW